MIRKYLPAGSMSRIYVDEQPSDAGSYIARCHRAGIR